MSTTSDPSLANQIAVDPTPDPDVFVSRIPPGRMGNALPIAYGGCTIATALHAAFHTVPGAHFRLYSALGHFLGPASTERVLHARVTRVRDTRSFATRQVTVTQTQPDGRERACLALLADFHAEEPAWLDYSVAPSVAFSPPERCLDTLADIAQKEAAGLVTPERAERLRAQFALMRASLESRPCPEGVSGQNLAGLTTDKTTSQDGWHITEKVSAEWYRVRAPLKEIREQVAALGFFMDGGLSFLPLTHMNMTIEDAAACSSLDFALRLFTPKLDLVDWHLKQRKTSAAGAGRTYSENLLWDSKGKLVASMTQQCIMRPKKGVKAAL
jgi:acyl-CoA thioesterase II